MNESKTAAMLPCGECLSAMPRPHAHWCTVGMQAECRCYDPDRMGHEADCAELARNRAELRTSEAQSFRVSDETLVKALLRKVGGRAGLTERDIALAEQATLVRRPGENVLEVWLRVET